MTTQTHEQLPTTVDEHKRGSIVAGAALIGIGLLILGNEVLPDAQIDRFVLPGLGLIFLLWAFAVRNVGLLIPGGVLTGLGVGAYLASGPLTILDGEAAAGAFLLSFAIGWFLIVPLSGYILDWAHAIRWPLIPGGILAVMGMSLIVGGPALQVLSIFGRMWPVGLIVSGLLILFRRGR